jgi:hypothetical protein
MSNVIGGVRIDNATGIPNFCENLFLESCYLACDEMEGVSNSPHAAKFMEALFAAVGHDRMENSADTLGYNGNSQEYPEYDSDLVLYKGYTIT